MVFSIAIIGLARLALKTGLSGIQADQLIRLTPGLGKVPIAAIASYTAESDRKNFLKQGGTHYLAKPFSQNAIYQLLMAMRGYFFDCIFSVSGYNRTQASSIFFKFKLFFL